MKATHTTLIKRSIASITVGMAALAPVSGAEAALFTVSAAIQEHIQPEPGCGALFPGGPSLPGGTITGSGISSFGAVSLAGKDCITPAADLSFSFQGKMTFTFFNGDQIFADYWGQFVPIRVPSIFTLQNSFFDITGGTGRFLGVDGKGNGNLSGFEDISTGWGLIQATGDITGLHKNKKAAESSLELLDLTDPADGNVIVAINELSESGSLALLGIGLASLAFVRRRVNR